MYIWKSLAASPSLQLNSSWKISSFNDIFLSAPFLPPSISNCQLLAEARVDDVDNHQRSVLHMAVEGEFSNVVSVLLENGADPDRADEEGNTGKPLSLIPLNTA